MTKDDKKVKQFQTIPKQNVLTQSGPGTGTGGQAQLMGQLRQTPNYDRQQKLLNPNSSPMYTSNAAAADAAVDGQPDKDKTPATVHTADYDAAIANNKKDRDAIETVLKATEAEKDTKDVNKIIIRNAAQWIREGKSKLYALTPTHDTYNRPKDAGQSGTISWFPDPYHSPGSEDVTNVAGGTPTTYKETYTTTKKEPDATGKEVEKTVQNEADRDENVYYYSNCGGFQEGNKIAICNARNSNNLTDPLASYISTTLRHEVQHAADGHGNTAFELYKTEFRAYWLDGRENTWDSKKEEPGDVNSESFTWGSKRQYAIFMLLYKDPLYSYVSAAWDADKEGVGFRKDVLAYKEPEGQNLIDSPRIGDLEKKMTAVDNKLAGIAVPPEGQTYFPNTEAIKKARLEAEKNKQMTAETADMILTSLTNLDETDWAFIDSEKGVPLRDRILAMQKRFADLVKELEESGKCEEGEAVQGKVEQIEKVLSAQNLSDGSFSAMNFVMPEDKTEDKTEEKEDITKDKSEKDPTDRLNDKSKDKPTDKIKDKDKFKAKEPTITKGMRYKVQISTAAVFPAVVKIDGQEYEVETEAGTTKRLIGNFEDVASAQALLKTVRGTYKDAWIVKYKDDKRV